MHDQIRGGLIGDGHGGAEFPAGVLERNLNGDAVGGERFDAAALAEELITAGCAGIPTGHAIGGAEWQPADGQARSELLPMNRYMRAT